MKETQGWDKSVMACEQACQQTLVTLTTSTNSKTGF